MTVKQLVRALVEMPMEAEICLDTIEHEQLCHRPDIVLTNYEDGCVGISSFNLLRGEEV